MQQFGGGRCVAILWVYSSMGVGYGKNGKKLYELRTAGPVGGFLNVTSAIRN